MFAFVLFLTPSCFLKDTNSHVIIILLLTILALETKFVFITGWFMHNNTILISFYLYEGKIYILRIFSFKLLVCVYGVLSTYMLYGYYLIIETKLVFITGCNMYNITRLIPFYRFKDKLFIVSFFSFRLLVCVYGVLSLFMLYGYYLIMETMFFLIKRFIMYNITRLFSCYRFKGKIFIVRIFSFRLIVCVYGVLSTFMLYGYYLIMVISSFAHVIMHILSQNYCHTFLLLFFNIFSYYSSWI